MSLHDTTLIHNTQPKFHCRAYKYFSFVKANFESILTKKTKTVKTKTLEKNRGFVKREYQALKPSRFINNSLFLDRTLTTKR